MHDRSDQIRKLAREAVVEDITVYATKWVGGLINQVNHELGIVMTDAEAQVAREEAENIRRKWNQNFSRQDWATRESKGTAICNWMKHNIEVSQKFNGAGWMSAREIVDQLATWGISFSVESAVKMRVSILGDWAEKLQTVAQVARETNQCEDVLLKLVEQGFVRSILTQDNHQKTHRYTSVKAVSDYYLRAKEWSASTGAPPMPNSLPEPEVVQEETAMPTTEDLQNQLTILTETVKELRETVTWQTGILNDLVLQNEEVKRILTDLSKIPKKVLALAIALTEAEGYEIKITKG